MRVLRTVLTVGGVVVGLAVPSEAQAFGGRRLGGMMAQPSCYSHGITYSATYSACGPVGSVGGVYAYGYGPGGMIVGSPQTVTAFPSGTYYTVQDPVMTKLLELETLVTRTNSTVGKPGLTEQETLRAILTDVLRKLNEKPGNP